MPCWYFDRDYLESLDLNSIPPKTIRRYRFEVARVIQECGAKLGLNFNTCAAALLYFQRFYLFHKFTEWNRYLIGAASLFLAGKVQETPKKSGNIIEVFRAKLSSHHFNQFGKNPRESLIQAERKMIETLKFDFQVDHPYTYLGKYARKINGVNLVSVQKMVQIAWTFVNDCMSTNLCLQWESDILAISALYLASKVIKVDILDWEGKSDASQKAWWEDFVEDMNYDTLECICHSILDLYSDTPCIFTDHVEHVPTPSSINTNYSKKA